MTWLGLWVGFRVRVRVRVRVRLRFKEECDYKLLDGAGHDEHGEPDEIELPHRHEELPPDG
jgi:hypothetical protein